MGVWILLCLGAALLLHDRPLWMALGGFGLWVLIPGVAGVLFTGRGDGYLALQPATWFVLACFVVLLVRRPAELLGEFAGRWPLYLILLFVILAASIMSLMGVEGTGIVLVTDQITGPIMLFWFASVAIRRDARARVELRNFVLALAALESVITIAQFAVGDVIVYGARMRSNYWFNDSFDRWMGTTDHPLVLGMLLCAAAPLVAGLSKAWVQVVLLVLMAIAVLITQSRTAAALLPVGMVYVVIRSRARASAKVFLAAALVAGGIAVLSSPLVQGLQGRLADDTGSTEARSLALDFFFRSYDRFFVYGDGITASYRVAKLGGLSTSLESAILMYAIGIGVITTALYFGAQAMLALSAFGSPRLRGALVSAVMVLVIPQTFSSLGVETLCGPLLWIVLAIASSGRLPAVRRAAASASIIPAEGRDRRDQATTTRS